MLKNQTTMLSKMDIYLFFMICASLLVRFFFIGSSNLLVEESYYWNYAQHLDFSYLDHPPIVAYLIKISTTLFGINEFGVRVPSVVCWFVMTFFSFKLSTLIRPNSGLYAVFFLSVLPFFFFQSVIITPDQPLAACWSATLYYLYRSIILNEPRCWYTVGIWFGLGMLSKYTMILLVPSTLIYLCVVPKARSWFIRKEPYLCALIVVLFFTPVVYWNATHEWVSFIFQGKRRFNAVFYFSFHHFIGLLALFLMPPGMWGLWELCKKNTSSIVHVEKNIRRFFQIYTLFPLLWFGLFSLTHAIKFDWIGPTILPLIPWTSIIFSNKLNSHHLFLRNVWLISAIGLLLIYICMVTAITLGKPEIFNRLFFKKYINWSSLTQKLYKVAMQIKHETHETPLFVALDTYNINSELSFYQTTLFNNGTINEKFPIVGRHIFGQNSLMYEYWGLNNHYYGSTLILITKEPKDFDNQNIEQLAIAKSPILSFWAKSQAQKSNADRYYYRVVTVREPRRE